MNTEKAIDLLDNLIGMIEDNQENDYDTAFHMAIDALKAQAERTEERTETHACDLISRRAAIGAIVAQTIGYTADEIKAKCDENIFNENGYLGGLKDAIEAIEDMPSAQTEPLSDAYMKAVWTWLLNYQIKAAELQGRYTPYEVLSWVANDWRKEHE